MLVEIDVVLARVLPPLVRAPREDAAGHRVAATVRDAHRREAGLDQQPAAHGRRPLRLPLPVRRVMPALPLVVVVDGRLRVGALVFRLEKRRVLRRDDRPAPLVEPIEVDAEPVPLGRLRGQPNDVADDVFLVDEHAAVVVKAIRHGRPCPPPPERVVEPQLVLDDRPADRFRVVVDLVELADVDTQSCQLRRRVVGHPAAGGVAGVALPAEDVPALLGNQGQHHAAGLHLRGAAAAARLDRHLLGRQILVVQHRDPVEGDVVERHAVLHDGRMSGVGPARLELQVVDEPRPADVGPHHRDPRHEHRLGPRRAGVDDVVEHLAGEHLDPRGLLNVDQRRLAGDGDGLFEAADLQLPVHRRREVRRDVDVLLDEGREARQAHRDGVAARSQRDDGVPAGAVGDGDAAAFDQHRAGDLHGDTRQDAPRVVGHLARDRALGQGGRRYECDGQDDGNRSRESHASPPSSLAATCRRAERSGCRSPPSRAVERSCP